MSNSLTRMKKKSGLGKRFDTFMKSGIDEDVVRLKKREIVKNSFADIRLIGYDILHFHFGFGIKRLQRLDLTLSEYLNRAEHEIEFTGRAMVYILKDKWGLCSNRYSDRITAWMCNTMWGNKSVNMNETTFLVQAASFNLFGYFGVILKTQFKFSVNQIKRFYEYLLNWIDTLCKPKTYDLTVQMIADELSLETGFKDARYVA